MEKNNKRYELIFGFVTLILSFSAFKDELKEIKVNLGFFNFTLAEYLLKIVCGFGICIYLYIIERISAIVGVPLIFLVDQFMSSRRRLVSDQRQQYFGNSVIFIN